MNVFKKIRKIKEHELAKNKNLEAVFITEDNAQELSEKTKAFSVLNNTLLVGPMHFHAMPAWMVCINPKSHKGRRYFYATENEFEKHFEVMEDK